jgi:hypothetical protein
MINNEMWHLGWPFSLSSLLYAILPYFLIFFYCASQMANPLEDWTAYCWSSAFHHHLLSLTKTERGSRAPLEQFVETRDLQNF